MSTQMEREKTAPGEESVWDYPRPPRAEETSRHIEVIFNGVKIADTRRAIRVLETSHPPVYYLPSEDVKISPHLLKSPLTSYCEWKGSAIYYAVTVKGRVAANAAWSYPRPLPGFEAIKDYIAFYPALMDACLVDGEVVRPQQGGFYGGWITQDIKGPFKGEPGTRTW